jgi:alkaline phosphatase D
VNNTDGLSLTRRAFLTGALAGTAVLASPIIRAAPRTPRVTSYPFALGVASGYPTEDGVVLWTRLAPDPLRGGGMGALPIEVAWEVAHDGCFRRIARRGVTLARPEDAHSVHIELTGLAPGRWYWYRFKAGSELSPVGRTRTAPAVGAELADLRFAFASCQHYEHGYYTAYRHMARDTLDLVVHLGDYIYEGSWGGRPVRAHTGAEPVSLGDYRNRYALYRSDLDLQAAHAAFPWVAICDDHEVDNDYANDRSEDLTPREQFLGRRAAAYRAYYEHMPLPPSARPRGPDMRLYTRVGFGGLAAFHVLDGRQYRDYQACPKPGRGGSNLVEACAERSDPNRSVLGSEQERWLTEGLVRSRARWNLITQQTLMARLDQLSGPGQSFWTDGWDGYPAARSRLLRLLALRCVSNPIVLGGDVHAFYTTDLKLDFDDPRSPVVATELVTTSISSDGRPPARIAAALAENPHIKLADGTRRGYTRVILSRDRAVVEMQAVDTVKTPGAPISTLATFVVEDGKAGALRG